MTDFENLENSKEYKALHDLEDALNSFSWDPKKFAVSISTMHRTLQQSLFRTIIASIQFMASEKYGYDLRNQGAHEGAKKIAESGVIDEIYLPLI